MTPEQWQKISEVAANAMELEGEARQEYLRTACNGDAVLAGEVAKLLAADEASPNPLANPDFQPAMLRQMAESAMKSVLGLQHGEMLGDRFHILRKVGSGGMGDVYEAEDQQLHQRVAVKTIRPELSADTVILNRFKRELQLARRVSHPNVCRVFDFAVQPRSSDGQPVVFLTMEFLPGITLSEFMEDGRPLGFADAKPILTQVLQALGAAHEVGVIHRDIKPSNIMLLLKPEGGWHVSVTDFGLAHSSDQGHSSLSLTGPAGTPAYISPEQLQSRRVTPASDLYSLGTVMYQMATGHQPWKGDSPFNTALQRLSNPVPKPSEVYANIDPKWEALILHLLQREPADRPQSAQEVLALLQDESKKLAVPKPKKAAAWWRVPKPWVAAGLLATMAACGTWLWKVSQNQISPVAMRWRSEGERAIEYRSFISAKGHFQKALDAAPEDFRSHVRMAQVDLELDQQTSAMQSLLQLSSRKANNQADQLLLEGMRAAVTGDYKEGLKALAERRKMLPPEEGLRGQMDLLWLQERAPSVKSDELEKSTRELLGLDNSHPGANLAAARYFAKSAKYDEAKQAFRQAQHSFQALGNLEGVTLAKFEEAEVLFEKERGEEPKRLLGEAEGAFNANIAMLSPGVADHLRLRLMTLQAQMESYAGHIREARELATRAVAESRVKGLSRSFERALLAMARIWIRNGDYEEAKVLVDSIADSGSASGCLRCLGLAQYYRGYIEMRKSNCNAAIPLHEGATAILANGGEHALALRPRTAIAECRQMLGDLPAALKELDALRAEAARLGDSDVVRIVSGTTTDLELRRGNYARAEELRREMLRTLADGKDILLRRTVQLQLANLLIHRGKLDEADQQLRSLEPMLASPDVNANTKINLHIFRALLNVERGLAEPSMEKLETVVLGENGQLQAYQEVLLCEIALHRKSLGKIRRYCEPSWQRAKKDPKFATEQVNAGYSKAEWLILNGQHCDAYAEARKAGTKARSMGNVPNEIYATLITLESAKGCAQHQFLVDGLREQLLSLRAELIRRWGDADTKTFFRRDTYRRRWNGVMKNEERI